MSISFFNVILAIVPPFTVLILMVGYRWGGSRAGPIGWLVALIIASLQFGAGSEVLFYAHIRSIILTVDVVYIVWMALLLYFVVDQAGALKVIVAWFIDLTGDDVLRVLLLGWVFTSFLQGVGGFGVPVAIMAPLLVGLGLDPLAAVIVPSIGHAWAVTFGSLGSSFITMIGVTGLTGEELAPRAAILLGISAVACGILAAHAYAGWRGIWRGTLAILSIGTVMAVVQYIVVTNGLWNIGSAIAGLAGLVVGIGVTRYSFYQKKDKVQPIAKMDKTPTIRPVPTFSLAITGYIILILLAFMIKGITSIKDLFSNIRVAVSIPVVETSQGWVVAASSPGLSVFGHTGAILLYSSFITYFIYRRCGYYPAGIESIILQEVWRKGIRPAIGILSMVAMATIMAHAGMTRIIAEWMSQAIPPDLYAFVGTGVGALGAFMTGSNTNSNAVFSALQMDAAVLLGLSVPGVLGIQTASASIASLLAPAKIIVGASTVGMGGGEGHILRGLLLYGGILLLIIAVMGFLLLQFG